MSKYEWQPVGDTLPEVTDNEAHEICKMDDGTLQVRVIDTNDPIRRAKFEAAVKDSFERYGEAFKRLANS